MIKKITYLLSLTLFLFTLSACDSKPDAKETAAIDSIARAQAAYAITVIDPYIRALPPGQRVSAMYMQLKNDSASSYELVKIESDISSMIELHTTTNHNGVMQMGEIESIKIAPHTTAEAKPGSDHVMIMGLQQDLKMGDSFDFKFIFKDGSSLPVTAKVKTVEIN